MNMTLAMLVGVYTHEIKKIYTAMTSAVFTHDFRNWPKENTLPYWLKVMFLELEISMA